MPRAVRTLTSAWDAAAAHRYLADLSNAAHWDPGVLRATRLDDGEVVVGSAFDLLVAVGGSEREMHYVVTALDEGTVAFASRTAALSSKDTVTVLGTDDGCSVTYDARLSFRGPARVLNPVLGITLRRVVDQAAASLATVLSEVR